MFNKLSVVNRAVGNILIEYFKKENEIFFKQDGSIVSAADKAADAYLRQHLPTILDVPIISEESYKKSSENIPTYWIVDPLDGTKEFIYGIPEFSVNIGLIHEGKIILGSIYNPVHTELYLAERGKGCWRRYKEEDWVRVMPPSSFITHVLAKSRSAANKELSSFIQQNHIKHIVNLGSALKFCAIANGTSSLYPRFSRLNQWDIVPGFLVVEESGGVVQSLEKSAEFVFSSTKMQMDKFICVHSGVPLESLLFPFSPPWQTHKKG